MGATRALVTVKSGVTYINDRAAAEKYLSDIAARAADVAQVDGISQRCAVVEAGMRVQQALGNSYTTPLAAAVDALRKLNATVNIAKHEDFPGDRKRLQEHRVNFSSIPSPIGENR